jgi:hypothetical protein
MTSITNWFYPEVSALFFAIASSRFALEHNVVSHILRDWEGTSVVLFPEPSTPSNVKNMPLTKKCLGNAPYSIYIISSIVIFKSLKKRYGCYIRHPEPNMPSSATEQMSAVRPLNLKVFYYFPESSSPAPKPHARRVPRRIRDTRPRFLGAGRRFF